MNDTPYGAPVGMAPPVAPPPAPMVTGPVPGPSGPSGPTGAMPGVYGGATTTAPAGIGQNGFGLHPETTPSEIVDYLLPKFSNVESGHDPTNYIGKKDNLPYDSRKSASGYYGYTSKTWGNYKGYPRAMDAPPEIQDEKMKADLAQALAKHGNDPYKAVANHYYPAHARDPTKWDSPIPDNYGNPTKAMTVNQYVQKIFPSDRVAKYLQGVNPSRQGSNDQASLQLP